METGTNWEVCTGEEESEGEEGGGEKEEGGRRKECWYEELQGQRDREREEKTFHVISTPE